MAGEFIMNLRQIHHDEQMEARRRDFETFWSATVLKLRQLKLPMLFWPAIKHIAWQAFRAAQK